MYKIYQIINIDGERYVGSTRRSLRERYIAHACPTKRKLTSRFVMEKPHTIVLIENVGYDKKKSVKKREILDR